MSNSIEKINKAIFEDVQQLMKHPYFQWLRSAELTQGGIKFFAQQYYAASAGFPIFLARACVAIEDEFLRMPIVQNLWDEHGSGDIGKMHRKMLAKFVESVGVDLVDNPSTYTRNYIEGMNELCSSKDPLFILGVLGPGCEDITAPIYQNLVDAFEQYGCNSKDLEFFYDHIRHDEYHSEGIYRTIETAIGSSEEKLLSVITGAKQALKIENLFWEGMLVKTRDLVNIV